VGAAEEEAVVPRVEVAAAAALHGEVGVAEVPPASVAEERQAVPEPRQAARPSAAAPSFPSRLRLALGQRPAVTRLAVHVPLRSQIAPPTARWWQAARGEVWSW